MTTIYDAVWREEVTDWDTVNHIYISRGTELIGFVPFGSKDVVVFKVPKKTWSVKGRKFRALTKNEIKSYRVNT